MLRINKLVIKIYYKDNKGDIKSVSPTLVFKNGVNFIWDMGKNSVGKSTCINSIFYALGIEELLGAKGGNTMKPVLNRSVEIDNSKYMVYETYILLEVNNGEKSVTIRRGVKGIECDTKLVRVYNSKINKIDDKVDYSDYFLHDPGAAQKEIGFHKFLEKFVNIELPIVSYNNDRSGKLYLQAITNLFFIEQIGGWTGFNVQKVYYGIKNIEKISIEYILGCTITDVDEKRNKLKIELKEEKDKWEWTNQRIKEMLLMLGDSVEGINDDVKSFDKNGLEKIKILGEPINKIKKNLMDEIGMIESLKNKSINENIEYISSNLKHYEEELSNYERNIEYLKNEYSIQKVYYESLLEQLKEIELKIRRYEDIVKLRKLGSDAEFSFLKSRCPVCDNKLQGSLLPKEINVDIMSNEDNLLFIKDEKKIIEIAIIECLTCLKEFDMNIEAKEKAINKLRNKIRIAKSDLTGVDKLPSETIIEKKYSYKEKLNKVFEVENGVEKYWDDLNVIYTQINKLEKSIKDLKDTGLSDDDQEKINKFQTNFRKLLKEFGYTSTNINSIKLSPDKYLPICEGFHLIYDSAGSDFIRAVWAYLLSLYSTSKVVGGNHLGVFVFDEPFQQQVSESSIVKFVNKLKELKCQSIIATSISIEEMQQFKNDDINIIKIEKNFLELDK